MTNKERMQDLEEYILDDQPLDEEDKELLERIYDRLDMFGELNRKYHDEARKCREIIHMRDPEQDDIRTLQRNGKKTIQLQTLKSTVNNVVADQMMSMPEAKLMPETMDLQQQADDLQDMVHYVVYCANNYEQVHYRLCEDFYTTGTMVLQVAWDPDMNYGKGEIALIRYPLEAFLWDPTADNIQDCRAVMKLGWKPLSWFRDHFPDAGKYVTSDENAHNNEGMTTGQEDADHANDEDRALMIEYWWREYDADKKRYTINVAYAAGNALLDVQKNVYAHGLYPFVIGVHDSVEGSLTGEGLVNELVPLMRYINRYQSYIDMNLRMSSKGRLLVRKQSGIDREALTDWENDIIEGDRVVQGEDVTWLQNQPFNSMINQMMVQLQTDLKQDSGANQFTRGETTGGIVSGKAINSLIQAGGKVAALRTEQFKYFFKLVTEQILWLMAQFYDDKRVMLLTGKTGLMKQVQVDSKAMFGVKTKGAVNPPPYSVQIEISTRDPQRIANQNQMFMEAYTMAAQAQQVFPLSALFQILNLDGKDRILPVIQANEQYQQQMQQMQMQLQQMGEQMQGMKKENESLKRTALQMNNALKNVQATGSASPQAGGTQPEPGLLGGQAAPMTDEQMMQRG